MSICAKELAKKDRAIKQEEKKVGPKVLTSLIQIWNWLGSGTLLGPSNPALYTAFKYSTLHGPSNLALYTGPQIRHFTWALKSGTLHRPSNPALYTAFKYGTLPRPANPALSIVLSQEKIFYSMIRIQSLNRKK